MRIKDAPSWFCQLPKKVGLFLIRCYQRFPVRLATCKFTPSCSEYTFEAISRFGLARGTWMGMKRIARCNPWNKGGFDPVPELERDEETAE